MTSPFILDTSVIISGLLTPAGNAGLTLVDALKHQELLFSEATFDELAGKLTSEKFARYLKSDAVAEFLSRCERLGTWVEPQTIAPTSRDPEDDMFLALALSGEANTIVSLDKDLLTLNPWQGVQIIKPAAYVERFMNLEL